MPLPHNHGNKRRLSPNERLFVTGQLTAFERAVLDNRYNDAVEVLVGVGFGSEFAEKTARDIFANPKKHGYCPGGVSGLMS